jgi:hypothetical protein
MDGGWRDFPGFKNQGDCVSAAGPPVISGTQTSTQG